MSDLSKSNLLEMNNKKYIELQNQLKEFEKLLNKKENLRNQRKAKKLSQLQNLQENLQEKTTNIIHKLQQLKRKQTIIITLNKIQPQIPENFPKNYYCQLQYEDVDFMGNPKFIDFDQNIIEEKIIIPLLSSQKVKLSIMIAEQNPTVFDTTYISLEKCIEGALSIDKYESESYLISNSDIKITYSIQLQGIGFQSWLKIRSAEKDREEERRSRIQQSSIKNQKSLQKNSQRKQKFNKLFRREQKGTTQQFDSKEFNKIFKLLEQ